MAATGTPTPNIGLRRPQGTDPASVDDINYNSNLIDTKLGPVGNTSVQAQINSLNSKFTLIEQNITFTESTARADVAKVYKNGPVAMVSLNNVSFTNALSSGDVTLATLPYKPMNWVRFFGYTVNGTPIALGVNPSSGNLICSSGLTPVEAAKLIYASCTYITND